MNYKFIVYGLVCAVFLIGWNVFLIKRDNQLFESYNQPSFQERFCKNPTNWHPDCNSRIKK